MPQLDKHYLSFPDFLVVFYFFKGAALESVCVVWVPSEMLTFCT